MRKTLQSRPGKPVDRAPAPEPAREPPWAAALACATIVAGALAAYHNSFSGPFVFDDPSSITDNPTIRHLWPPWQALAPPGGGLTVSGRPLVNFSLALNYAFGGLGVWGYHALNLLIHILASLVLFGVIRRTLDLKPGPSPFGAVLPAFAVALVWAVHPLQTESVTYVIQRAESLMGLFYLLTLYGFIRGISTDEKAGRDRSIPWFWLSWLACLCGMATKEVMVSVPLVVLLYDRTFVGGDFLPAWRARKRYYCALAGTWLLLVYLVLANGNRGGTSGVGVGVGFIRYWLTQFEAVTHYLRLTVWPKELIVDYGVAWVTAPWSVLPHAVVVVGLLAASAVLLARRRMLGLAGIFFFFILAPTSLVAGSRQTLAEHRMYLPLISVAIAGAVGAGWVLQRLLRGPGEQARLRTTGAGITVALACWFGFLTAQRNLVYQDEITLWADTAAKRPNNAWAHNGLGVALSDAGRPAEAMAELAEALRLSPGQPMIECNFANLLNHLGRVAEAIPHYELAVTADPRAAQIHYNFADALSKTPGRASEAISEYEAAIRLRPNYPEARKNLAVAEYERGNALRGEYQLEEAMAHYQRALVQKPDFADCLNNLGALEAATGQTATAIAHFKEALRIKPDFANARRNLAIAERALNAAGKESR